MHDERRDRDRQHAGAKVDDQANDQNNGDGPDLKALRLGVVIASCSNLGRGTRYRLCWIIEIGWIRFQNSCIMVCGFSDGYSSPSR